MANTAPLLDRSARDSIAWLSEPIPCLDQASGIVSTGAFLDHVNQLARALPQYVYAINRCDNRYLFLVSLCAAVLRGQTNLLPSNKNITTQERLRERYCHCYIIHDSQTEIAEMPHFDISQWRFSGDEAQTGRSSPAKPVRRQRVPQIELDQVAAISFTSGSTGDAKPNIKTWRTLVDSTRINRHYMLPTQTDTYYHLATVPGQHMWGFETSVLMALFAKVCIVDARPFYPHDIRALLLRIPAPRALVTTPLHLRALYAEDQDLPPLANILSATSPLSQQLAAAIERRFDCQIREIYGCSEVGSMAVRHTSNTDVWETFEGLCFTPDQSGGMLVEADHLIDPVVLEDHLEMLDSKHFRLHGRASDQINIAGKRGSLHEVNKVLLSFPGLRDGIVFFPPQDKLVPRLAALVVLAKGVEKRALQAHFRRYLDAAFVPRPIFCVASLPREDNGKLIKQRLLEFYQAQGSKA